MGDLVKQMNATLKMDVVACGSAAYEYAIARAQFQKAADRIKELEAERMERADTNASLLAKNIRLQETYTRLYAAYKSSEQDLTALITAIDKLPRYDIAQNLLEGKAPTPTDSIVKGLWVDADALQAVLEKQEGNSDG